MDAPEVIEFALEVVDPSGVARGELIKEKARLVLPTKQSGLRIAIDHFCTHHFLYPTARYDGEHYVGCQNIEPRGGT